jgi:hypothetical protein
MRRAIETDYDYKHWFRDYNIDRPTITPNQLLFRLDPTQYFEGGVNRGDTKIHTTSPRVFWISTNGDANSSLNPKVQLKDSAVIHEVWENLGRYMSEKEIKTCADWLHYISGISSASSIRLTPQYCEELITTPVEKIKINVYSDETDFGGEQPYFRRSLLSFMVLHNDGKNVILTPLLNGTAKFPFENKVEEVNYPHAEDVFVSKLCSAKSKNHGWVNELFVVNIDSIEGQPENSRGGSVFDDELKFGDFIHSSWDFNTNEEGITEIGEAILGDNLVYDLIPKTDLYVGGNLIEKMLRLTNDNYNKYAMLDLMNELTHQAERLVDTHTVSTTTKVKTSKTTFIPTWKDNRPTQMIDLTDGEYVMYSDIFRCPVCNVKVKVIGKGSNRKSQAECPLCKRGQIEFPHLVNTGVEEE